MKKTKPGGELNMANRRPKTLFVLAISAALLLSIQDGAGEPGGN